MIYPSGDTIEERVGSRYSLVVLAAKRAKQIKEGAPVLIETASTNPLTIALEEIAAGKVAVGQALAIAGAAETGDEVGRGDDLLLPRAGRAPDLDGDGAAEDAEDAFESDTAEDDQR